MALHNDEQIFIRVDMVKAFLKIVNENESKLCNGMTEQEFKAYHFGVDLSARALAAVLTGLGDEIFVHIPDVETQEEFIYEDLIARLDV